MSDADEYLATENGNGNGHSNGNGNGHAKVFQLKPALDPATQAILESREHALHDSRLNRSMKAFFCEVLDRALDPNYYAPNPRGIVTMSDTVLAEVFRVSNRIIYTWKKGVEACGYFWITQQFRKNMWPITTYLLACLHRPPRKKTDSGGTYGSAGVGRPPPQNPGLGARRPGQPCLPLPGTCQKPPKAKSADLQGNSGENGNLVRVSAETDFGSEPKPASGESRNGFRARAETDFGSEPKPISAESRSQLRARAEADCQLKEPENGEGDSPEPSLKRSTGSNALKAGGQPRKISPENLFLLDVGAMMETWRKGSSKAELANSGGWWRIAFRTDRDLMRRVLAETLSMVKEGKVKEGPGQTAVDLWKRWGGKLPKS
jgi:hypothetical protein